MTRNNNNKIVFNIGIQSDGYVFRLQPKSRQWLQENHPHQNTVASLFLGFDTKLDILNINSSIWEQVCQLLTGFSILQLNELGGFSVYNPIEKKHILESSQLKEAA